MMENHLSIILPTMRQRVFDVLEQYRKTTHYPTEIVVVTENQALAVDIDQYLYKKSNDIFRVKLVYHTDRLGALKAWNVGLEKATGKYIFPSGDDQWPYDNWFLKALGYHNFELAGYGMVGFNDLNLDGNTQVATTVMYDRQFCKDILGGVSAYEHYHYYCVDIELNERAKQAGKFYWAKDAIVEHLHCSNGKREQDWIDDERLKNNYNKLDWEIYEDRKNKGFPNNFVSII